MTTCRTCQKTFEMMVEIYTNYNKYEYFCISCFSSHIFKYPNYLNIICSIKYLQVKQ
jgi:hypothetical protein